MSYQPAIVIAAYNRPQALQGLLDSLLQAQYPASEVPLVISIDGGGGEAVIAIAEAFDWPNGIKIIIKHPKRLGLKAHMLYCGGMAQQYESQILLEDDLEVAPGFYQFAQTALQHYQEDSVAGISLYSYQISEASYEPFMPDTAGLDAYLMQFPSSWGLAFTAAQWQGFTHWLQANPNSNNSKLPAFVQRWGAQSWKKLFVQYLLATDGYFLYPRVSFATNKGYAGAHFAQQLTLFDVPLYKGAPLQLPSAKQLKRYNVYFWPMGEGPNAPNTTLPNIALAEYRWRAARNGIKPSAWAQFLFVANYQANNYWNAFWQKVTG